MAFKKVFHRGGEKSMEVITPQKNASNFKFDFPDIYSNILRKEVIN